MSDPAHATYVSFVNNRNFSVSAEETPEAGRGRRPGSREPRLHPRELLAHGCAAPRGRQRGLGHDDALRGRRPGASPVTARSI
ncbi:hypothetical protein NKG05_02130 [Oerskovia sp. M15]